MTVKYSAEFLKTVKKIDVRIYKCFRERVGIFIKDSSNLQLNNHELRAPWQGFRSIDVTSNWRAIFEETEIEGEKVVYFVALGTHKELYGHPKTKST